MGEKKLERYMTIDEVAEFLQMSRATVYKKASEGLIKSYKPGKKVIFDPNDVRAFVKRFQQ